MTVSILTVDDEADIAELFRQHFPPRGAAGSLRVAFRGFS